MGGPLQATLLAQQNDYRTQKHLVLRHIVNWAKRNKLGNEWRLLEEIIKRSRANRPWSWTSFEGNEGWAAKLYISKRTLQRYIKALINRGLLEVTTYVRDRQHGRPNNIYTVPQGVLYRITEGQFIGTPPPFTGAVDFSANLSPNERQNGTKPPTGKTPETPMKPGVSVPRAPGLINKEETTCKNTTGTAGPGSLAGKVKNLVKRPIHRTDVDHFADPKPTPVKGNTPASRIGNHFQAEWDRVRAARPDVVQFMPWSGQEKARFYAWAKKQLLAHVSEQEAMTLITDWCTRVISHQTQLPPTQVPVYVTFHRSLDNLRAARQTTTTEVPKETVDTIRSMGFQL